MEQEEGQNVREYHDSIDQIRAFPYEIQGDDCTDIDHDDINQLINADIPVAP